MHGCDLHIVAIHQVTLPSLGFLRHLPIRQNSEKKRIPSNQSRVAIATLSCSISDSIASAWMSLQLANFSSCVFSSIAKRLTLHFPRDCSYDLAESFLMKLSLTLLIEWSWTPCWLFILEGACSAEIGSSPGTIAKAELLGCSLLESARVLPIWFT